jgi:hypothetical protein
MAAVFSSCTFRSVFSRITTHLAMQACWIALQLKCVVFVIKQLRVVSVIQVQQLVLELLQVQVCSDC